MRKGSSHTPAEGDVKLDGMTPYQRGLEVERAVKALQDLVSRVQDDSPETVAARSVLAELKAEDMAEAMLSHGSSEAALVMWNKTRRAAHAMGIPALMAAARKIGDEDAPGDTRVILEVLKGLGILTPGAPEGAKERAEAISRKDLEGLSDAELDRLLEGEA